MVAAYHKALTYQDVGTRADDYAAAGEKPLDVQGRCSVSWCAPTSCK